MNSLAEKLELCKVCTNRTVDFSKGGLICNLTQEQPAFENECANFNLDAQRKVEIAQTAEARNSMDEGGDNDGSSDMLWGAVWCVGGIVATAADFGYVFWGAILFGGIQFVQGVMKSNS